MILRIPRIFLLSALIIVALPILWTGVQAAEAPNSGEREAVLSMAELLSIAVEPMKIGGVASTTSDTKTNSMAFSLAVKHLGVPLQQGSFTLADLSKRGGPAILRLSKPEQFVTVAAVGPQYVSFYDQGAVMIVDRNALADRYTKEAFVLALPSASAPNLKFDDPVPVVKVVSGGGEVIRKIKMTNSGSQPISLEVESTSCGCTVAALSSKTLAPGQTGTIEIKMKVGAWGKKTERVTLKTSDPLWPRAVIGFQVQVPTTVVPTPSELTIEVPKGQAEDRALFVIMPSNAAVVKVTTLHPFVKATLEDIQPINEGHAQRVKISVTADAPLGIFNDNATFELKGAEVPRISVPIKVLIQPDVDVNPHQLFLGQIAQGKSIRKTFIIQSRSGYRAVLGVPSAFER